MYIRLRAFVSIGVMIAVLLFVGLSPARAQSGPFGFYAGETKAQVIAAIGRVAIKSEKDGVTIVRTAPKPHPSFEEYALIFSPTRGLVKVRAIGKNIENDAFGSETRAEMERLSKALTNVYGKPSDSYDFLMSGSIWRERSEFLMGILKKQRTLAQFWADVPGTPNQIKAIGLEAEALSDSTGYVCLGYEFLGFNEFMEHEKSAQDSVL